MPVSKNDVLLALLALDAYNRHDDNQKVKISENNNANYGDSNRISC